MMIVHAISSDYTSMETKSVRDIHGAIRDVIFDSVLETALF